MLIVVKNLVLDSDIHQKVFDNILHAFKEKNHVVWVPKKFLKSTLKNQSFLDFIGSGKQSIIERLLELGDEIEQLRDIVSCYLEIDFTLESEEVDKSILVNKQVVYKSSYKKFSVAKSLNETKMFAENNNDCLIYEEFGKIFLERLSLQNRLILRPDKFGGGGSSTAAFVKLELDKENSNYPILCIADADIEYPDQELAKDKTAKKALDIYLEYQQYKVLHVHVIDAKYIENLMPHYISEHVFVKKELGVAHEPENEKFRLFLDKKKRITLKCLRDELANLDPMEGRGKFISDLLRSYIDEPDSKLVTLKIHGNDRLAHYLDKIHNDEIRPLLINDETSIWNKVAKHVFSWSLSHNLC